ncbi:MAG: pyridoxamine 5'-phosphate oxidase family protein [Pseudonocardia sp.]
MAKVYDGIDAVMASWIEKQPVFFVATAPLSADGLVNLSPKGTTGTFRVVDEHTFAYLDMTGSGVETIAHLQENGRICVMLCAFDGRPQIVRLHGTGSVVLAGDPGFDAARAGFGAAAEGRRAYARAVVVVGVTRVSDSCGYAVPRMDLVEERDTLDVVWRSRDDARIATYHAERNATSLDGLPGLPDPQRSAGATVSAAQAGVRRATPPVQA